jgi:hypothetical protein
MRRTAKEGGRVIGGILLRENIDLADERAIRVRVRELCGDRWTRSLERATLAYLRRERKAEECCS